MMNVKVLDNGDLELSLEALDANKIENLQKIYNTKGESRLMGIFLSEYSSNNSYTYFDAGNANPYVGLSDAPCIAECMYMTDGFTNKIAGKFWYYVDYTVIDYCQKLLSGKSVVFTLGEKSYA